MLYYKVKPESDQTRHTIQCKKGTILVANELYTERVINSALTDGKINHAFIDKHFTKVNIKPANTYWFFGARFECPYTEPIINRLKDINSKQD